MNPSMMTKITAAFVAWRQRAAEAQILRNMSPRELSDLGLTRGDVERVIEGTYVNPRPEILATRRQVRAPMMETKHAA